MMWNDVWLEGLYHYTIFSHWVLLTIQFKCHLSRKTASEHPSHSLLLCFIANRYLFISNTFVFFVCLSFVCNVYPSISDLAAIFFYACVMCLLPGFRASWLFLLLWAHMETVAMNSCIQAVVFLLPLLQGVDRLVWLTHLLNISVIS